jgi:hypothetical protein
MGSLRMLCCTKGDKYDDSQDPPARPAQPRPEKDTQSAPASFKSEACSNMSPYKTKDEIFKREFRNFIKTITISNGISSLGEIAFKHAKVYCFTHQFLISNLEDMGL